MRTNIDFHPAVLIAEDESMLQELYKEACDNLGIGCVQCMEGLETWSTIEDLHDELDVIILDIMMPGLSGEAIINKLQKKYPEHPPVIVVSAIVEGRGDITALQPGSIVYIAKGDVSLKQILVSVKEYYEKSVQNA